MTTSGDRKNKRQKTITEKRPTDPLTQAFRAGDADTFMLELRKLVDEHGGIAKIAKRAKQSPKKIRRALGLEGKEKMRNLFDAFNKFGRPLLVESPVRRSKARARRELKAAAGI